MGSTSATGRLAALALAGAALCGCASSEVAPPAQVGGMHCVDDSPQCIGKRQADLKAMMSDKSRAWVRQPADARAYASGVRLFAYRGKRKELNCDELAHGKREADGAVATLKGPGGAGLTPAQISRGSMLATEVSRELGVEMTRRCRRA